LSSNGINIRLLLVVGGGLMNGFVGLQVYFQGIQEKLKRFLLSDDSLEMNTTRNLKFAGPHK
jgi:hypothetical protein